MRSFVDKYFVLFLVCFFVCFFVSVGAHPKLNWPNGKTSATPPTNNNTLKPFEVARALLDSCTSKLEEKSREFEENSRKIPHRLVSQDGSKGLGDVHPDCSILSFTFVETIIFRLLPAGRQQWARAGRQQWARAGRQQWARGGRVYREQGGYIYRRKSSLLSIRYPHGEVRANRSNVC